jgi:transposase
MAGKRKVHTAAFKAQVALAAHKGDRTVNELAGHYSVHPTLIHGWKKQLITGAQEIFEGPAKAAAADAESRQAELYEQIGRLKMELEWLKKTTIRNKARTSAPSRVTSWLVCPIDGSQRPGGSPRCLTDGPKTPTLLSGNSTSPIATARPVDG